MIRIVLLILLVLCYSSSMARTAGYKFEPDNGATMPIGLNEIKLSFAREVRLTSFKLFAIATPAPATAIAQIDLADALSVPLKDSLPRGFNTEFTLYFDAIEPGNYLFSWAVVAKDGDVFDGRSQFAITR